MQQQVTDERNFAMWCHLSPLVAMLIPFIGNILAPLILWVIKKDESSYIDHHGREALNFQITMTIAFAVAGVLMWVLIGFVLMPIFAIWWLVLVIVAAIKANSGELYRYPMTIRLI